MTVDLETPTRRRSRLPLAAAAVLSLVVLGVLGWQWRHPHAFPGAGNAVGFNAGQPGTPVFFGVTYPEDGTDVAVTIHDADVEVVGAGADATVVVCTLGPQDARSVGVVAGDVSDYCTSLVPAAGAELDVGGRHQVLLEVVPDEPGTLRIDGVDLLYSQGWQRGWQRIGSTYTVRTG